MLEMDCIAADIITLLKEPDQAADSFGTRIDYLEFRLKNMDRTVGLEETSSEEKNQGCALPTSFRLFTQLRANHLLLLTQFRSLASARMASARPRFIQALVSAADDNVWVCKAAMEGESIPTLLRPTFVHFLMAAVSSMILAATYDSAMYGLKCRRPFEAGLEILEAWSQKPRGVDPRHRYSVANLRNLGQRARISNDDASDHSLINAGSALDLSTALTLDSASSSDANPEQSWNTLPDEAFTIGEMSAQMHSWDERWLDFVFNNYGAGVRDNEKYPI